jgi:ribosomal protein S27AE
MTVRLVICPLFNSFYKEAVMKYVEINEKVCPKCGAEIVYRYESGKYNAVCCSIECLQEMEDSIEFGLEFGFDD